MFFCFATSTLSWAMKVHTSIIEHSLDILAADNRPSAEFYKSMNKYVGKLKTGCVDPDIFEFGTGTHYYKYPGEGTVNTGQYFPPMERCSKQTSARIRLEDHYQNALALYKEGNYKKAFHTLGRAVHYLCDIGCPPHSAGVQYPTNPFAKNPHHAFESYADKHCKEDRFHATTASSTYGLLSEDRWAFQINKLCQESAQYEAHVRSYVEDQWDAASVATIALSERFTCELLDKFYNDIQN